MRKDWEIKNLNEVASYSIGLTYSPKDVDETGVVVLRSSNIQDKKIDLNDIVKVTKKIKSELFVREGDILMCSRNGSQRLVGKTAIIPKLEFPATYGTFMTLIRSDYNNYLFHFFNSDLFKKQIWVGENTMINQVTKYMLDKVTLPIPPLEEQQKIVEKLDKAFELIDQAKANIEQNIINAKELFQSKLDEVFSQKGDEILSVKISDVILKAENINPSNFPGKIFKYIDVSAVNRDTFKVDSYLDIDNSNAPSRARKLVNFNDIIFSTVRPTLKRAYIVEEDFDKQICSTGYCVLRPDTDKVISKILFYYLLSTNFIKNMELLQKGASYPAVTDSQVKGQILSFPKSISKQKNIVRFLDEFFEDTLYLAKIYQQKLSNLEELRKSILEKAFKGELTN